jgi:cell division septation protein DedD
MAKSQTPFRFDHREMTVIFSLFIFTSLLMFTVGIMVGKGIAQPSPENSSEVAQTDTEPGEEKETSPQAKAPLAAGTSVSTDHPASAHAEPAHKTVSQLESVTTEVSEPPPSHPALETKKEVATKNTPKELPKHEEKKPSEKPIVAESESPSAPELELIPERPRTGDVRATLADLADTDEVNKALKNPKVQALLEESPTSKTATKNKAKKRANASVTTPNAPPKSFPEGKFTVQVGSYPSQADATLRLEQLRKQGFPYAYTSVKELGDKKEPWYRVWLGYFQDPESAKAGGELLQQRGEVKSYLVRKSETKED